MSAVVARRYARAFFDVALRQQVTAKLCGELDVVADVAKVCADLLAALSDDNISFKKRERLVDVLGERLALSTITGNFLKVLVSRHRIACFLEIVAAYHRLVEQMDRVVTAEVTTAIPPADPTLIREIETATSHLSNRKATVVLRTDANIIGGLVVQIEDQIYDGSFTTELKRLRETLMHS